MGIELNKKDKRILYELNYYSRQPISKLAKKLKLSKQSVNYRVNKLVEDGFIKQFYTLINFTRLGYKPYKIFLRMNNLKKEEIDKFLEAFKNTAYVVWTVHCDGEYDIILGLIAKNTEHFKNIYYEILEKHQKLILFSDHSAIISAHQAKKEYLSDKQDKSILSNFYVDQEIIKIDKKDSKILRLLAPNSKISIIEMAGKLNLTSEAVRIRLKNLQKRGIIMGSSILLDTAKIDYLSYKVLINLKSKTMKDINKLTNFLNSYYGITEVINVLGSWDLEIDLEVKSISEFKDIITMIRTKFKELISNYTALIKYEEHSYNYYPIPESDY